MTAPTPPSLADEPRAVRITTDGAKATVTVDGTDMSKTLAGYTLEHRAGQPPMLVLYPTPNHQAAFDGLAHVVIADEPDPGPTVAAFLRTVDPVALERAALARDDLDGTRHELTRAMLAQLTDWALGKAT
ncbi:hypothetical protein [Streptomyces roseoviridis]|uniref:Prevent-host-death family protein n=1 Tax=Streptomyces roseoviridis TaxID=67361 RepID=A0ABV5QYQ6_9ACTN